MTCAEMQALMLDYALGVLDADDRAACEAHLRQAEHDGCLEALRRATAAVAVVPAALPATAPSPGTWAAIEARLAAADAGRGAAGQHDIATAAERRTRRAASRRSSWSGWVVAAAVAVVAIVVLVRDRQAQEAQRAQHDQLVAELEQLRGTLQLRQDAIAMLQRPGTRLVALAPLNGPATANLIYRDDDTHVFVVSTGLRAPPGKALQLWAIRGETQIPQGVLTADASGTVHAGEIAALRDGHLDAFGVTLEPAGGPSSSASAHGPVVLYGKI